MILCVNAKTYVSLTKRAKQQKCVIMYTNGLVSLGSLLVNV